MQIIQSIAAWAAQQPAWIDDAVRRLVAGGLTPQDFQELSALAKAEHGLPGPKGRVAVRLDPKTLPAAAQDGVDVSLAAVRSPQNLNAIDPNQALTFQATGLTIVYGHNGAGKSGYRRMRDTWELLIEEHLFAGTVKRFRRAIETSKLRYVSVDDAEASAVYNGMTRCSNFTHEGGAEAPPALPEPSEFISDVEALATSLQTIENNKKATEKRRVEAGQATST
ncbi:hypothetical protein [Roseateles sp. LKC17W]|uniref:Uncharacterized protein n=1 Tax=Pelomonas margarita TaxID=3299031 RepID=A0ABW7FGM4_9BURK